MKTKILFIGLVMLCFMISSLSCEKKKEPAKTFTVTFNTNGGSTIEPIEVTEGLKITKPEDPDKTGLNYVVEGWYTDEELTEKFDFDTDVIEANITLYVKYEAGPTVTYNGFTYHTTKIGTQVWMRENLLTRKYRNGTSIINAFDNAAWHQTAVDQTGAYGALYYENQDSIVKFGLMYNFFAIDPAKNGGTDVCPEGWHVPTNAEWIELITFLTVNGYGFEGSGDDIAKALASKSGSWNYSSTPGTVGNNVSTNDITGFSALPGGFRGSDGVVHDFGNYGYWWSSTTSTEAMKAWTVGMHNTEAGVPNNFYWKDDGFAIRCIKNR